MEDLPYVVLMGNVGSGKSTLVEKLADVKGQSSESFQSFTKEAKYFLSKDKNLIINDTPGANSMIDKLSHNQNIAAALCYQPVSKIFIVVKADTRMDTTVDDVRKYAEQLIEINPEILGVIVTHMDIVKWTETNFLPAVSGELGLEHVIFSNQAQNGEKIQGDILKVCSTNRENFSINGDLFFKMFKISNNNVKILKSSKAKVDLFRKIKMAFDEQRRNFASDESDLLFEFQAYMTDLIVVAQKQLGNENNFTFQGDGAANELGHVANMTNQLRAILLDIRVETLQQGAADHGVNDLRKCPHCGLVWDKIVGCDGNTTCGELVQQPDEIQRGMMATFNFICDYSGGFKSFKIEKSAGKEVTRTNNTNNTKKVGCGNSINWSAMARVAVPFGFSVDPVNTNDISMIPEAATKIAKTVGDQISRITQNMRCGNSDDAAKTEDHSDL